MIVVIVGPTGVGKTKLSIALAKHFHTEIISGDSVQVYQGLNIGSAKIKPEEMENVKHHMLDIKMPNEPFSVAVYQRLVRNHIDALRNQNKLPLIVGGTGFYIKSVLHNFDFTEAHRPVDFDQSFEHISNEQLHTLLAANDPKSAAFIHPNNRKRVLQAFYRSLKTVKRSEQRASNERLYDYVIIGLTMPREKLHQVIETRVDAMFEEGLLEEVEGLHYLYGDVQAFDAIGYKEVIGHLKGFYDLETAKTLIKTHTRQYAKRQYTYFNNQFDIRWMDVNTEDFDQTIETVIAYIESKMHTR